MVTTNTFFNSDHKEGYANTGVLGELSTTSFNVVFGMVVNKGRLTVFNPSNDTSASTTLILTYSDFQHPGDLIIGGPSTLDTELTA
jgi:hypothetical protein